MNQTTVVAVSSAIGGAAVGSGATYILLKKRIIRNAEARANEEIQSVKDTYRLLRKEPPYDDPVTATKAYLERVDELQYSAQAAALAAEEKAEENVVEAVEELEEVTELLTVDEPETVEEPEVLLQNIFDQAKVIHANFPDGVFDAPADRSDELSRRDANIPFIIPTDEFMDDSNEFDKITITYFEADDTVCDERESIIPDVEGTVGRVNLHHFGEDSDSADTVYIRNERLRTDFEVVREQGSYAKIVLGVRDFNDSSPKVRKMRDDE